MAGATREDFMKEAVLDLGSRKMKEKRVLGWGWLDRGRLLRLVW